MGLLDIINKVIGKTQSAVNTAQNAKYTYDQAKNTADSVVVNNSSATPTQQNTSDPKPQQ